MSKGTRIYSLRLPPELMDEVEMAIERSVGNRAAEPYNRTTWIIAAIREKLAHLKRSSGRRKSIVKGCNTPLGGADSEQIGSGRDCSQSPN